MKIGMDISVNSSGIVIVQDTELVLGILIENKSGGQILPKIQKLTMKIHEIIKSNLSEITEVCIEDNIFVRNYKSIISLSKITGAAISICGYYSLNLTMVHPSQWKSQVCKNNKITKLQTINFVKKKLQNQNYNKTINSDIADAYCISQYIKDK